MTREEPPNRLVKMGAMPTPFKGLERAVEDTPPLPPEREESRAQTPPSNLFFKTFFKLFNIQNIKFTDIICVRNSPVIVVLLRRKQSQLAQRFTLLLKCH